MTQETDKTQTEAEATLAQFKLLKKEIKKLIKKLERKVKGE